MFITSTLTELFRFSTPTKKHLSNSVTNVAASLTPLASKFDHSKCVVRPLPEKITAGRDHFAIVIDNVLSEKECADWISTTEMAGYGHALVNIGGGRQEKMDDVRNSTRCIVDDADRAADIWSRVCGFIPEVRNPAKIPFSDIKPIEVNERLRFLKYDPGEFFAPHYDGAYTRRTGGSAGDTSMITLQVYLNEGFEGGSTRFFEDRSDYFYDVVPKTGSVLLFDHPMLHSGESVIRGRKYALRSDIMFTRISR